MCSLSIECVLLPQNVFSLSQVVLTMTGRAFAVESYSPRTNSGYSAAETTVWTSDSSVQTRGVGVGAVPTSSIRMLTAGRRVASVTHTVSYQAPRAVMMWPVTNAPVTGAVAVRLFGVCVCVCGYFSLSIYISLSLSLSLSLFLSICTYSIPPPPPSLWPVTSLL